MQLAKRIELLVGPYDRYERHLVVGRLLRQALPAAREGLRILDVGGRSALLTQFTRDRVISINMDGTGDLRGSGYALPFRDGSMEAAVSMDTLEHLPEDTRLSFIRECLRVARLCTIIAAPLGSEGHRACEERLDNLYRSVCGEPHPYLSEHLLHGLPELHQLEAYLPNLEVRKASLLYAGDYLSQARAFERSIRLRAQPKWRRRLSSLAIMISTAALFNPVRLHEEPSATTNRFYWLLQK